MQILEKDFVVFQIPTPCLSQFAYYVESDGDAAIIDPLRDVSPYLEFLKARGVRLRYVIETHFHADYVAGHCALAEATGAEIIVGPNELAQFEHKKPDDGEVLRLGKIDLKVLHTPGHTLESICILLVNPNGDNKQEAVFTGDTLFVGDVGRPDLAVKSGEVSINDLARHLFTSINKLKQLDDTCKVLPAHGAGSPCGKNLSSRTYCTIGGQKESNHALQLIDPNEFCATVTSNITEPPQYFKYNVSLNMDNENVTETSDLLKFSKRKLMVDDITGLKDSQDYVVLDTRDTPSFEYTHIPGSVNVPLAGQFAIWAASVISPNKKIIIVCENNRIDETIIRLARTGLHNIHGYLDSGIESWIKAGQPLDSVQSVDANYLFNYLPGSRDSTILDVRNKNELEKGVIENSTLVNLNLLDNKADEHLFKEKEHFLVCAGGVRSVIGYSVLRNKGYDVKNIRGGFGHLVKAGFRIVKPLIK